MCFDDSDCDWHAEVIEQTRRRANKACRCDECREPIEIGDWFTHVWMQEHEECEQCVENENDPDLTAEEREHVCSAGETFACNYCESCRLIRHAIYEVEKEEGCPERARHPHLMGLQYVFDEHSNAGVYARRAIELHPEVAGSRLLKYAVAK